MTPYKFSYHKLHAGVDVLPALLKGCVHLSEKWRVISITPIHRIKLGP